MQSGKTDSVDHNQNSGPKETPAITKIAEPVTNTVTPTSAPIENISKIALHNCSIIDGRGELVIEDGVILIEQDKIVKVGTQKSLPIPDDYQDIDLNGNTVLPGFINTHVHNSYNLNNLQSWLKGGVTTVRDLGNIGNDEALRYMNENNVRTDTARILSTSPVLTVPGGYGNKYFNTVEEAKELVTHYSNLGVKAIRFSMEDIVNGKNMNMPTYDEYSTIVETAHSTGRKTIVHITHSKNLNYAVELGVDQIAHMVTDMAGEDLCKAIADKGIYWIPTLELWKGIDNTLDLNDCFIAQQNLKMFYKEGGKIALGTGSGGYSCEFDKGFPITEVKLMKEAGMSNMDIILAGTRNAAEACDMSDRLGTVEEGKIADLLVVTGDPLKKIDNLANTYLVIHNGKIVDF
jgi:Imidazolonepropionase and related amidohydrolases